MGVMSDVCIVCQEPVFERFKEILADNCVPEARIMVAKVGNDMPDVYMVLWYNIKWKREFDYVQKVSNFVRAECYRGCSDIGCGIEMIEIVDGMRRGDDCMSNNAEGMPDDFYIDMVIHKPNLKWKLRSLI